MLVVLRLSKSKMLRTAGLQPQRFHKLWKDSGFCFQVVLFDQIEIFIRNLCMLDGIQISELWFFAIVIFHQNGLGKLAQKL
jgi:hypothetical protein